MGGTIVAKTALIIVDVQRDYFSAGALPLDGAERAGDCTQQALDAARAQALPIIVVQHVALSPQATFFRPNTPGVALHPCLGTVADNQVVVKHFPNAFRGTDLKARLDALGVQTVVVAGMMTHMCIDSTVRQAADLGLAVTLLGDATATRALTFNDRTVAAESVQTAVLAALHGTFAEVVTTASWAHL